MTGILAPVALFAHNRPLHMQRTLAALAANPLAASSLLIVFSDGPRTEADTAKVAEIRALARQVTGFAQVHIVAAPSNQGLARSIIGGVTRVTEEFGRVIVVEDDLETSPHFLGYMNDALERYADQPRVAAISGYLPPMDVTLPETFFQRDAECWGWATWRRAWSACDFDGARLLAALEERRLLNLFDMDGTYPYAEMLRGQIAGRNDSWAVRWRAFVILADMLSLYPGRSLLRNIGLDGSGTHSGPADYFGDAVSATPIRVEDIPLVHCREAFEGFKRFNRRNFGGWLHRAFRRFLRPLRER